MNMTDYELMFLSINCNSNLLNINYANVWRKYFTNMIEENHSFSTSFSNAFH